MTYRRWGGREGDISPPSMVPSTMILMLSSISGLQRFLVILHPMILTVRRFLAVYGLRFALMASGGSCGGQLIFLHLVGGSRELNGITHGWDQVRVGSGKPKRGLLCLPAFYEEYS